MKGGVERGVELFHVKLLSSSACCLSVQFVSLVTKDEKKKCSENEAEATAFFECLRSHKE
jgi:hypothetical protein